MNEELQKTIDFAIAKEEQAVSFYEEWAAKAQLPSVRQLFTELSVMERGHVEKLRDAGPAGMMAIAPDGGDLRLSELLVDVEASPAMSLQEALILGMKREEAAVALYDRLATLGGDAQPLFRALADEERNHKRLLETEYDTVILTEN
ncbi:MAG: ferritin family protein [Candidatus Bipolaricaulota bacterium]|nr:MAG: ferritin family protein [Candidatus Bipolaricaulota bacterium]